MKSGIFKFARLLIVLGLAAARTGAQDANTNAPTSPDTNTNTPTAQETNTNSPAPQEAITNAPLSQDTNTSAPTSQYINTNLPAWLTHPLTMTGALNLALQQNGSVLRGKSDLEAQYGLVVQTRAVAIPKVQATGNYQTTTETETYPFPNPPPAQGQTWNAGIQVVQAIYQGGQIRSALRTAKYTKEQALLNYQTVIADALLQTRIAYYDVLSAEQQVLVEEASVKLLTQQLDDQTRRYDAGTVPRFNVLQAQVELSNERPKLIQARNVYRVAKNNLVNQLGENIPVGVQEDVPLELADKLDADAYPLELTSAIVQALQDRTELLALRKQELLEKEAVTTAQGNYRPTISLSGGYGARNTAFDNDLQHDVKGWTGGAQATWNIFDGMLTIGKIEQAKALYEGAKVDVDNEARSIELEVRTDYSDFIEAREVLDSQEKVQEEAEESLRLATARSDAGTGTQLDVLSAQTSLTQARSTQVRALHDYDVARARLERAIGLNVTQTTGK
jgi:outer membrane protein TolC